MARFKLDDGSLVDTDKAAQVWEEHTTWNGSNRISVNTGSQWEHQTLYLTKKGRYYLVHESQWQGSTPSAELLDDNDAAKWLAFNGSEDVPVSLQELVEAVIE